MSASQICRFYMHKVEVEGQWVDREYVHIKLKGNPRSEFNGPASDRHRELFAQEYFHFKNGLLNVRKGVPVAHLPGLDDQTKFTLEQNDIQTIEELANLEEASIEVLPGGRLLKARASAYLAALKADEPKARGRKRAEAETNEAE